MASRCATVWVWDGGVIVSTRWTSGVRENRRFQGISKTERFRVALIKRVDATMEIIGVTANTIYRIVVGVVVCENRPGGGRS